MRFYCTCALVLLLAVTGILSQACSSTDDCKCGKLCVGRSRMIPCPIDETCRCRSGCGVGNLFIKRGRHSKAYCNQCRCSRRDKSSTTPMCTRRDWCGLPDNSTVYPTNSNCM